MKESTKMELGAVLSAYYDEYAGLSLKTKRFLQQIGELKDKLSPDGGQGASFSL